MRETTALGAAIAAGFAVGVWKEFDELKEINQKDRMIFKPNVDKEVGEKMFKKWGRVSDFYDSNARVTCADITPLLGGRDVSWLVRCWRGKRRVLMISTHSGHLNSRNWRDASSMHRRKESNEFFPTNTSALMDPDHAHAFGPLDLPVSSGICF
jgi:hypothetical protein